MAAVAAVAAAAAAVVVEIEQTMYTQKLYTSNVGRKYQYIIYAIILGAFYLKYLVLLYVFHNI
jgi:hypothetical protein